jgi:uncharacterized protein YbaR (Trm112 family)
MSEQSSQNEFPAPDAELLAILRCPVARAQSDNDAAGKLELHRGCWLVCSESGLKYPIRGGIPVMLVEEGQKWKETDVSELPVPPPE